jgi:hypothetical protein
VLVEAFNIARQAGLPALSGPKCILIHLGGPVPASLLPAIDQGPGNLIQASTGFRVHDTAGPPHRLLGVPFAAPYALRVAASYDSIPAAMVAKGMVWRAGGMGPNKLGRSHLAGTEIASKPTFQLAFHQPRVADTKAMQRAVSQFVAAYSSPEEESPSMWDLFPSTAVAQLPLGKGGIALPNIEASATAMGAKVVWRALRFTAHPWASLFRHELSGVAPELGMAWVVVLPPGVLKSRLTAALPSLESQHAVSNFSKLSVRRILEPHQQDFDSIMLEFTWPPDHPAPEGPPPTTVGWHRLRHVRAAWLQRATLDVATAFFLEEVIRGLPWPYAAAVQAVDRPMGGWWALPSSDDGPQLLIGTHPDQLDAGCRLWELWPSGLLTPAAGPVGPRPPMDAASALVSMRPKPPSTWSQADLNFHRLQLALRPSERTQIMEPWLVGIWEDLAVDPRVWGLHTSDQRKVSLLDMTVREARLSFQHHRFTDLQSGPLGYKEGGAAWPNAWSRLPDGHQAGPAPDTPMEELNGFGLAGREEQWRRSFAQHPPPEGPLYFFFFFFGNLRYKMPSGSDQLQAGDHKNHTGQGDRRTRRKSQDPRTRKGQRRTGQKD